MGAGIEPCQAAPHDFHLKLIHFQIAAIDVGNLEFAARRRPQGGSDVKYLVIIKIQAVTA